MQPVHLTSIAWLLMPSTTFSTHHYSAKVNLLFCLTYASDILIIALSLRLACSSMHEQKQIINGMRKYVRRMIYLKRLWLGEKSYKDIIHGVIFFNGSQFPLALAFCFHPGSFFKVQRKMYRLYWNASCWVKLDVLRSTYIESFSCSSLFDSALRCRLYGKIDEAIFTID